MTLEELKKIREEKSVEEIQESILKDLNLKGNEMTALRALKKADEFQIIGVKTRERKLRGGGSLYPVNFITSLGNQIDSENFTKTTNSPDAMPSLGTTTKEKIYYASWCIKNKVTFKISSIKEGDEITYTDEETGKERSFTPKTYELKVTDVEQSEG